MAGAVKTSSGMTWTNHVNHMKTLEETSFLHSEPGGKFITSQSADDTPATEHAEPKAKKAMIWHRTAPHGRGSASERWRDEKAFQCQSMMKHFRRCVGSNRARPREGERERERRWTTHRIRINFDSVHDD